MKEPQMKVIADLINLCAEPDFEKHKAHILEEVEKLTKEFPLYND